MTNNELNHVRTRAWALMCTRVLAILEGDDVPSSSALEVCRKWIDTQGVTADVIHQWTAGTGFNPKDLPTFPDDPNEDHGHGTATGPASLRNVAAFSEPRAAPKLDQEAVIGAGKMAP